MTRAAVSIPSNIAEGAERNSTNEFVRFLNIARGSSAELRTQVHIAVRIGVLSEQTGHEMSDDLAAISKMFCGLAQKIMSSN